MHASLRPVGSTIVALAWITVSTALVAAAVVDFEDLSLSADSHYAGEDGQGGFHSRGAFFVNEYTDLGGGFHFWSGWSYSNHTDVVTPGFTNQYSAYPGGGAGGSSTYAVAFASTEDPAATLIELPQGTRPRAVSVANTTYAALSMLQGDSFAKKFGGPGGADPDYFLLRIHGLDASNTIIGTVEFYLADFRFDEPEDDHMLDQWLEIDLSPLSQARRLGFTLASSDVGPFGMNTPAYFALDNLVVGPEPALLPGDVNGDRKVDLVDFNILKSNFGKMGVRGEGDLTGDGIINLADFNELKTHFGTMGSTAVPEPATWLLAALATAGALVLGSRRADRHQS